MVVGDQGALDRGADLPVEPDGGVERQQALDDPRPEPGRDAAAVAFESELVFRAQMIASTRWRSQFGKDRGSSSLRAGRMRARFRSGPAKNASVSSPDRPLSVTMAVPGAGRFAGWCSSICRACSRSPSSLGLARQKPVTVPSQVTMSSSLVPQYQREWLGQ